MNCEQWAGIIKAKTNVYEKAILFLFEEEASELADTESRQIIIANIHNRQYQLLLIGWLNENQFIDEIRIHFHIINDGKIWLLQNNTDRLVFETLVSRGIPKSDLAIGFHPSQYRKFTGYATA